MSDDDVFDGEDDQAAIEAAEDDDDMFERATLRDDIGSAAIEGEVEDGDGRIMHKVREMIADHAAAIQDTITARIAGPLNDVWSIVGHTADGAGIYVGPAGTPEPVDLGHVAGSAFGTPAPPGALIRTSLINGSPSLHIGDRPVAWFENWLRNNHNPGGWV